MAQKSKILALIGVTMLLLTACGDRLGDTYVGFGKCLTEKGAIMYGAYWCPHCANQKKMFGKQGFEWVKYVECDPRGDNPQTQLCLNKKIEGYPTWDFADGTRLEGEVRLSELGEKTGCELPPEPE